MAESARYIMAGLFALFLASSVREMLSSSDGTSVKEIPKTTFQHAFTGPTLKFYYW